MRSLAVSAGLLALASALPSDELLVKRAAAGEACGGTGAAVCGAGLCCSAQGVCGSSPEFCAAPGCQLAFSTACDGSSAPSGTDTSNVPRPKFGNVPYGVDIRSCTLPNKIALTFDDGPYIYTPQLLDILEAEGVKATFMITGTNGGKGTIAEEASGYPAILRRMVASGHQIGSHTWSHLDLGTATPEQRRDEIIKNEIAFASVLGGFPTYLRPPYTDCDDSCMADVGSYGYHIANYDLDTKDWENGGVNAKALYTAGLANGASSYIVLAHDIHEFTVPGGFTKFMIDGARARGLEFVTMGECLGDPPANWYRKADTGEPIDLSGGAVPQPPKSTSSAAASSGATSSGSAATSAASSTTSSAPMPTKPTFSADFGGGDSKPTGTTSSVESTPTDTEDGGEDGDDSEASPTSSRPATVTSPSGADVASPQQWVIGALMGAIALALF